MFKITEHQYNIIMKQAQSCYPQETGGFLEDTATPSWGFFPFPTNIFMTAPKLS